MCRIKYLRDSYLNYDIILTAVLTVLCLNFDLGTIQFSLHISFLIIISLEVVDA